MKNSNLSERRMGVKAVLGITIVVIVCHTLPPEGLKTGTQLFLRSPQHRKRESGGGHHVICPQNVPLAKREKVSEKRIEMLSFNHSDAWVWGLHRPRCSRQKEVRQVNKKRGMHSLCSQRGTSLGNRRGLGNKREEEDKRTRNRKGPSKRRCLEERRVHSIDRVCISEREEKETRVQLKGKTADRKQTFEMKKKPGLTSCNSVTGKYSVTALPQAGESERSNIGQRKRGGNRVNNTA